MCQYFCMVRPWLYVITFCQNQQLIDTTPAVANDTLLSLIECKLIVCIFRGEHFEIEHGW